MRRENAREGNLGRREARAGRALREMRRVGDVHAPRGRGGIETRKARACVRTRARSLVRAARDPPGRRNIRPELAFPFLKTNGHFRVPPIVSLGASVRVIISPERLRTRIPTIVTVDPCAVMITEIK